MIRTTSSTRPITSAVRTANSFVTLFDRSPSYTRPINLITEPDPSLSNSRPNQNDREIAWQLKCAPTIVAVNGDYSRQCGRGLSLSHLTQIKFIKSGNRKAKRDTGE